MAGNDRDGGGSWCAGLALAAIGVAVAVALGARTELHPRGPEWSSPVHITILHTNDIEGQVLPPPAAWGVSGGLVALGHAIRRERAAAFAAGDEVLLLDAGDLFKGTPEGDLTNGEVMVAWMNHVGYDAMTVGNHDFDHGVEVPRRLARLAQFPLLGGNCLETETGRPAEWLGGADRSPQRGAVLLRRVERRGVSLDLALIGLTTSEMKDVTLEGVTDGLEFPDEVETLAAILDRLPAVDLVVLLTHCGVDTDRRLAEAFAGRIHVIVGGHSHSRLQEGETVGDVLVAQAGAKGRILGKVRITVSPPATPRERFRVDATAATMTVEDDLEGVLQPFIDEVAVVANQPVGRLIEGLGRGERGVFGSSALGNLETDLMRAHSKADVAIQNQTGIRADLAEGPVTYRNLYEVAPFGNTVVTMRLQGADLWALLDRMLEDTRYLCDISGVEILCDPARPEGERLIEARVGGQPLDRAETYVVATNNFLSTGGDGHVAFTRGTELTDTLKLTRDLLQEHFAANMPYEPPPLQQRIKLKQ